MRISMDFTSMILGVVTKLYQALVFMFLYNWFLVTTFGLPTIGYLLSLALLLTFGVIGLKNNKSSMHYELDNIKDKEKTPIGMGLIVGKIIALTVILLIGWLIKLNIY